MKKFRLWLSSLVYRACQPRIGKEVGELVEWELARHHRLTADIRRFILEDLETRIPREGTTHALACHVRDHAKKLEERIASLEQRMHTVASDQSVRRMYGDRG